MMLKKTTPLNIFRLIRKKHIQSKKLSLTGIKGDITVLKIQKIFDKSVDLKPLGLVVDDTGKSTEYILYEYNFTELNTKN